MRKHKKRKNWATHDVVVKDGQGRIKKVISKKTLNRTKCYQFKKPKIDRNIEKIKDHFRLVITKYEYDFLKILKEVEKKIGYLGIEQQKIFPNNKTFYVADFYLNKIKLIIEIDGWYHNSKPQKEKDDIRDKFFNDKRIKTIRIKNKQVKLCKDNLFRYIKNRVMEGNQL